MLVPMGTDLVYVYMAIRAQVSYGRMLTISEHGGEDWEGVPRKHSKKSAGCKGGQTPVVRGDSNTE